MRNVVRRRAPHAAALLLALSAGPASAADADPAPSLQPPAAMHEIAIPSAGARLNGLVYLAAGAGAHPVVLFLHGYPGNERNLDLAQAVRRAGFHAVYFDGRGSWGSGGVFTFAHALEDVAAALAWVRAPENVAKYRLDPARVALVGHSFGGWLALETAQHEPAACVAALAAWNVGWAAQRFPAHEDERAAALEYFRTTTSSNGGPIVAPAEDLLHEMTEHANGWDYLTQASALKDRALFLASSRRDTPDEDVAMHDRLAKAVRAAGGTRVTVVAYDDDHGFSSHRLDLAARLVAWLRDDCRLGAPR